MYSKNVIKFFFIIFLLNAINGGCINHKSSLSNRRYIFVDGGAHMGETIEEFEKSDLYSKHPWEIFSFEANPDLIPFIPKKKNITVINKAMWTDNKGVNFFFGTSTTAGNIVKTEKTDNVRKPIYVDSVDFGQWLKKNFKQEDIVFVKMDIEGAEYQILDKMLEDGSIKYVDKLYVEFHSFIMDDIDDSKDKEIVNAIKELGIPIVIKSLYSKQGDYFKE